MSIYQYDGALLEYHATLFECDPVKLQSQVVYSAFQNSEKRNFKDNIF